MASSDLLDLLQHLDDPARLLEITKRWPGIDLNDPDVKRVLGPWEPTPDSTGPILLPADTPLLVMASSSVLVDASLDRALATVWALARHRRVRPWLQFFDDGLNGSLQAMPFVPTGPLCRPNAEHLDGVLFKTVQAMDQRLHGRPFQVVVLTGTTHQVPFNGVPAPRRDALAPRGDLVVLPARDVLQSDERQRPLNGWHVHTLAEIQRQVERLDLEAALRDDGMSWDAQRPRSRL